MKQPLFKRRRVSSNSHAPLPSSDALVTSSKPSRFSICASCHRAIRLKSNPAFPCARSIVFSSDVLMSHQMCWVNTTGATHQHVPFACGRARVIQYLAPGGQVLSIRVNHSISGAIRLPFHFPKATRTTHLNVEDVPVTKIAMTCRSQRTWIASSLAVDRWCVGRVALNTLKGQNPLNRTVSLSSYRTCSVGPSPAWTARQSNLHHKPMSQMLQCKELGIQTSLTAPS
jgi:hypothetical protein